MPTHNTIDNCFKRIFADHRLFADFLKDFIHIDILESVKPEDIEDLTERFLPLFQENRDADTVKRVRLKEHPLFVIAILEHESNVNHRSCFKMLQYICLVLDAWEKDAEKETPGSSLLKDFKYPPVLPMILYDGKGPWTAQRNFPERTHMNTVFEKYIPKFEYELVNLNDYNEEEIMRFGDALSIILLADKALRRDKGTGALSQLPHDYVEKLRLQIPKDMIKLLTDVIRSLMDKGGFGRREAEEAAAIVEMGEREEYGGMFEAVIESIIEEREEARAEGMERGRVDGMVKGIEKGLEKAARNLLAKGAAIDYVHEITGLDREAIRNLSRDDSPG
jgi:predicted transposase/invertase (TIGR01784 family)